MDKPSPTLGMHHLALYVTQLEACTDFYTRLVGMTIDWQPDPDNIYLTTGSDNFALHRAPSDISPGKPQRLDHFGFFLKTPEDVDHWHAWFINEHVKILAAPRNDRDGTRSFYCDDPDGNAVQFIHIPKK